MNPTTSVEKENYRQFFQSLEPDGGGKIKVSTFKELLKKGMGNSFDDERASQIIGEMSREIDGKISVDELAESFSMGPKSNKLAFAMRSLLEYYPEVLPTPDLRQVYDMFGIDISPDEASDLIEKARKSFSNRLAERLQEEPLPKNKQEVKQKKIELMKMLEEKIVGLGGSVPILDDEEVESD